MVFFADNAEDMDWPQGQGQATRVLYYPTSTKGRAPVALPDDVPEVDHAGNRMTGTPWSFRGPKSRVYPRWPVTGALTLAFPHSDTVPEGVTDPNACYKA